MSYNSNLKQLSLTDLADRCAEETELFFKHRDHDTSYCFELFRQAIRENNQYAWEKIYNQYQSLVSGWVQHHTGFETSGEEVEFFVTGAFAKITSILTSEKIDKFSDLQSLLSYLKMCVHSVITDYNRKAKRATLQVSLEELRLDIKASEPAPELAVLEKLDNQTFWTLLKEKLNDKKERLVMQGLFVLDLKPRELCDYYEGIFTDVEEVYRIKQNIFARLRRDSEFSNFFGNR